MIRVETNGLPHYRFSSLAGERLVQAVFTRLGGCSRGPFASLNVGHLVGDDLAAVAANHRSIYSALGISAERVVTGRQVHGCQVTLVTEDDVGTTKPDTDALITNRPDVWLVLRFADCVPILFYTPESEAVGLAHAGWQGTAQAVAARTAERICAAYGCRADELYAAIGPSIGPCCYEVGADVANRVIQADGVTASAARCHPRPDKAYLDLWQANADQLSAIGVRHIEIAGLCTCCHRDVFFSHRGDGGTTGRFAAVIGLRPGRAC